MCGMYRIRTCDHRINSPLLNLPSSQPNQNWYEASNLYTSITTSSFVCNLDQFHNFRHLPTHILFIQPIVSRKRIRSELICQVPVFKYQYISNNFYLSCASDGTRTRNTRFKRPVRSLLLSICATEAFLYVYICFRFRSGSQDQICFRFIILIITVWEPQESNL